MENCTGEIVSVKCDLHILCHIVFTPITAANFGFATRMTEVPGAIKKVMSISVKCVNWEVLFSVEGCT